MAIMRAGLGSRARRVLERLAVLVCPPDVVENGLTARVVEEFELHLGYLPAPARRLVGPALVLFDQAARLRPAARGHRFVRLTDVRADAYLRRVLYGQSGPLSTAVRLTKSLVVMACYELAEVKAGLGYDPDPYITEVTARRIFRHGPAIRAAEARTSGGAR